MANFLPGRGPDAQPRPKAPEIVFKPLASGALGDVNARDGDSGFNAEIYAGDGFAGTPVIVRLEPAVGAHWAPLPAQAGKSRAMRWTATLTPKRTGRFPLALRSTGEARLKLDGNVVLERSTGSDFTKPTISSVTLERGKPYEVIVEFIDPSGRGRVAAEWAAPASILEQVNVHSAPAEAAAGPAAGTRIGPQAAWRNQVYALELREDGSLLLTERAGDAKAVFQPEFAVVHQAVGQESRLEPKGGKYQDDGPVGATNYVVPAWDKETDFFVAAHPRTRLRASACVVDGGRIQWRFPDQPAFSITAEASLPEGAGEPVVTMRLKALAKGQFSAGYVGAPEAGLSEAQWIWQPLVWQDRRFPNRSYLTKEYQCPIPFVMLGMGGSAIGVGADPSEMPYRMPTNQDSRFGVLIRNAAGRMQPMLFAPVPGGPGSQMAAGQSYDFTLRLFVRRGAWFEGFKHLARNLYQFGDIRENALCSLNTTLDNMMEFLLTDEYSYWYPRYKTWGYQNDAGPGGGRQQSAADALALALVCDNAEFFRRRALPTLEYMLSRRTVSIDTGRSDFMGGPVNSPTDLVAAYRLSGGRTTALKALLEKQLKLTSSDLPTKAAGRGAIATDKAGIAEGLNAFRLTGNKAALRRACAAADRYIAARIERPAENFGDLGSSFWYEMSPVFDLLYELYAETGQKRYLDAAAAALRQFTAYVYLVPVIPPGNFTANPGGIYNRQPVPEETVPAWRVSANGLTAECAGTAHSHRGVFMASHAAWMARLARDTSETFFLDIARNAVVGRYANYPSYAYRNGYSTVYEKPDYPLRPFEEIKKFTSAHYNHPLPMAAFLVDYLVSEVYTRSGGQITFPSEYTNTGAFFRNRLYGVRPGRFYDEAGVNLWLPRGLLKSDSIQINTLAGYGNGKLYLALANQSARAVNATIAINPERVALAGAHRCRVWTDNTPAPPITMTHGRAMVTVSPKGLTCLAVEGAAVRTEVNQAMLDPAVAPLPAESTQTVAAPFGGVTATALRLGRGLTSVHVWLKAGPERVRRASLVYSTQGGSREVECERFPFEFTIPVGDADEFFCCRAEVETPDGETELSPPLDLCLQAGGTLFNANAPEINDK